jgi:hypothetical protein
MTTIRNLVRAFAAGSVLAAAPALAQDTGFYIGGAAGQSSYREMCNDFDEFAAAAGAFNCQTREATGGKIFAGWRFHRYLAAEISYIDFGKARATGTSGGAAVEGTLAVKAAGISALGMLPLGDSTWIFGRLGALQTQADATVNGAGTPRRDETEIHTGIGGIYDFSRRWAMRVEYERAADIKVDLISLGVQFRF